MAGWLKAGAYGRPHRDPIIRALRRAWEQLDLSLGHRRRILMLVAKRAHVFISGQVQGVGFRWFCRDEALRRRLAGFVRNLPDGRVEAVFEGDPVAVEGMVEWCRSGADFARVESVEVQDEPPAGDHGFVITR